MSYDELLKEHEVKSLVCVGLDPVVDRIPINGSPGMVIERFFLELLEGLKGKVNTVKPNYAFFAQYGFDGIKALKKVVDAYKNAGFIVILDAKRGDIGKTSKAYASEAFDFFGADSVTVAPYMGSDSVGPFIDRSSEDKGVYVLNRTSNKGAVDIQNLEVEGVPVYMKVAEKIVEWSPGHSVGAVIGATYLDELKKIASYYVDSKQVPLLIPGVGSQGGSASEVVGVLKEVGYDLGLVRINSSSGILYAHEKYDGNDYVAAAVAEVDKLNQEIGL